MRSVVLNKCRAVTKGLSTCLTFVGLLLCICFLLSTELWVWLAPLPACPQHVEALSFRRQWLRWETGVQNQVFPEPIPLLLLLLHGCLHRREGYSHHMAVSALMTLSPVALGIVTLRVPQTIPQEPFHEDTASYFLSDVLLWS